MKPPLASVLFLILGLVVFGLGEALLVAAGVGVSPWIVFAEGVTNLTGWSLGFATFAISVSVLGLWIPLRQAPGMGTVLNAVIIALVLEFALPYLPTFETYLANAALALAGVFVTGFGGAIYLIANLGPGPRDGLMTGLQAVTGQPIAQVRTLLELTVVAIGWALGGLAWARFSLRWASDQQWQLECLFYKIAASRINTCRTLEELQHACHRDSHVKRCESFRQNKTLLTHLLKDNSAAFMCSRRAGSELIV